MNDFDIKRSQKIHQEKLRKLKPRTYNEIYGEKKAEKVEKKKHKNKFEEDEIRNTNTILVKKIHNIWGYFPPPASKKGPDYNKIRENKRKMENKKLMEENRKFVTKLQNQKSSIAFDDEEELNKKVISMKKIKKKQKINLDLKLNNNKREWEHVIDETIFYVQFKWEPNSDEVQIMGTIRDQAQVYKVIKLSKQEAKDFIRYQCDGDIDKLLFHLHYDQQTGSLSLSGSEILDDEAIKQIISEEEEEGERKIQQSAEFL